MRVEPRDDKEISRILVVNAHPDDADFGVKSAAASHSLPVIPHGILLSRIMRHECFV